MGLRINPYIILDGTGIEAVDFYKDTLGAKVLGIQTYGDMPDNPEFKPSAEAKNRVMHASLKIGNSELMITDTFPGQPYQLGSQLCIAILPDTAAEANELFAKLQDDGEVIMPLQETDWSPAYGQVKDKFGITWQVSAEMK
ncbi:VOC family protein [Oceanobacillus sp. FSL K6-2867]|uniref:VOC family protein n=1 Tax=Oceanobacillus sp. FSL K6-2867 TaxID=2954748 RepID=UPI0030DAD777